MMKAMDYKLGSRELRGLVTPANKLISATAPYRPPYVEVQKLSQMFTRQKESQETQNTYRSSFATYLLVYLAKH